MSAYLKCIEKNCNKTIPSTSKVYVCPSCEGLLDVDYDFEISDPERLNKFFLKGGVQIALWM